jgi:hypothetical protein
MQDVRGARECRWDVTHHPDGRAGRSPDVGAGLRAAIE